MMMKLVKVKASWYSNQTFHINNDNSYCIDAILNAKNYSRVTRLFKVTSWVLRFCNNLRKTLRGEELLLNPQRHQTK